MTIKDYLDILSQDHYLASIYIYLQRLYRTEGECIISFREIARWLGASARIPQGRIKILEENGLIATENVSAMHHKNILKLTNVYGCFTMNKVVLKPKPTNDDASEMLQQKKQQENEKIIEKKKADFVEMIAPFVQEYGKDICNEFYRYWSEVSKDGKKLKWELQPTWETNLRLARFRTNQNNKR